MAEISIAFACGVLAGAWLVLRLANSRRGININPTAKIPTLEERVATRGVAGTLKENDRG